MRKVDCMSALRAALGALVLLVAMAGVARAGGVGEPDYNYVHPPAYLRASNAAPAHASGTIRFHHGISAATTISTADGQAGLRFPAGAAPGQPGARGVRVAIDPVARYPTLPLSAAPYQGLRLDGNAYAFHASYLPAGSPVTQRTGPIDLLLLFPHTPTALLYYSGHAWRQLCSLRTLKGSANKLTCRIHAIPAEVAMLYNSGSQRPLDFSRVIAFVMGVLILAISLVVMGVLIYRNFVRASARR